MYAGICYILYNQKSRLLEYVRFGGCILGRKEQIFGSQMNCLLERAKKQKNVVELQEIRDVFQNSPLTQAQLERIDCLSGRAKNRCTDYARYSG